MCPLSHFSCVWLFVNLWTKAQQAPLSVGFSRQEYWNLLLQGIFQTQGSNSCFLPAMAGGVFTTSATWEAPRWLVLPIKSIDISGISELKWTGTGEINSDDHYTYYCRQESLRRNGVALIVNKRVWNAARGCNLKNDRMISVCFQGKSFNITVIQVYALAPVMLKKLKLNGSMKTYKTF